MDDVLRLEYLNKVIDFLKLHDVGSLPEIICGHNKYPDFKSALHFNLIEIQSILLKEGLVIIRANDLNGFYDLNLTNKGQIFDLRSLFKNECKTQIDILLSKFKDGN